MDIPDRGLRFDMYDWGSELNRFKKYMEPFYCPLFWTEDEAYSDKSFIPELNISAMFPSQAYVPKNSKLSKKMNEETMPIGLHDFLDLDICVMARKLRIDCVILQREIGSMNSVSEILDTRLTTHMALTRITDPDLKLPWFPVQKETRYPNTWFPKEHGFVMDESCCRSFHLDPNDANKVIFSQEET